jgi:hypothetical protein
VAQDAAQEERQRHLRHAVARGHQGFGIAPAIIESCASRIFLPNPQATEPQIRTIYEGFGLNSRQIEIVATAQPKRDYYYQSRLGNRLFDLDLGPATLAFAGASTPQDQRDIDRVLLDAGVPGFAGAWLRHRGLDWAADLLPSFPGLAPGSPVPLTTPGEPTMKLHTPKLAALTAACVLAFGIAQPARCSASATSCSTRPIWCRTRSPPFARWSRSTTRSASSRTKRRCSSTRRATWPACRPAWSASCARTWRPPSG